LSNYHDASFDISCASLHIIYYYWGADTSLARPTSRCIDVWCWEYFVWCWSCYIYIYI